MSITTQILALLEQRIPKSLLTTAGDLIYRTTKPARLPIGTAYQKLRVNSGATAPEWATDREVLSSARTYYVRTDGNDSNTGLADTAGGAFLTIAKALNVAKTLDLNGNYLYIYVRAGTYAEAINLPNIVGFWKAGCVQIIGDETTPANVLVSATSNHSITASGLYTHWAVKGLAFKTTTSGSCVYSSYATIYLYNVEFQDSASAHVFTSSHGSVIFATDYRVTGNATYHWYCTATGSFVNAANRTVTIDFGGASKAISYWCYCNYKAQVYAYSMTFTLVGGSAVTGTRRYIYNLSHVLVNGASASYFPGNVDGTVDATTFAVYG